jgi:hypothetical protein
MRGTESCGDDGEVLLLEKRFRTGSPRKVDEKVDEMLS